MRQMDPLQSRKNQLLFGGKWANPHDRETVLKAQTVVCSFATDGEEAKLFLDMLGIKPRKGTNEHSEG